MDFKLEFESFECGCANYFNSEFQQFVLPIVDIVKLHPIGKFATTVTVRDIDMYSAWFFIYFHLPFEMNEVVAEFRFSDINDFAFVYATLDALWDGRVVEYEEEELPNQPFGVWSKATDTLTHKVNWNVHPTTSTQWQSLPRGVTLEMSDGEALPRIISDMIHEDGKLRWTDGRVVKLGDRR